MKDVMRLLVHQKINGFSSTVVISAIEESLREFWGNWGRAPRSEFYNGTDMMRLYTGVPFAFCNGVICNPLSPGNMEARIEATVSYYIARNATWEWVIGPNSNPASLERSLINNGFSAHGESVGMAIDLQTISQDIQSPENLTIIQVRDDVTMKMWANTMVAGFEAPALNPSFIDLECSLGYQQPSYHRFLGLLEEQPVSTCALLLGEKVAGIYCVSTLPTVRGLGIGAATTLNALREAQESGYRIAVLQSSQMGRNVYRRLGFKEFSTLRGYSM